VQGFLAWLGSRPADRDLVEAWVDTLDIDFGARRNYLSHLHQFYVFASERTGSRVPTEKIRRPPQPRTLPRPIRDEHLRRALDRAPNDELRCWLLLGAYAGLRCLEIAGLHLDDIEAIPGQLRVRRGKGGKPRNVALHPEVASALDKLLVPSAGPIFLMPDGRQVPAYVVSQRINRHLDKLGIPSTAHSLRHWFGTNLYQSSQDIVLTQRLLGHSSVATTMIYADCDQTKAAPAVRALSIGLAP